MTKALQEYNNSFGKEIAEMKDVIGRFLQDGNRWRNTAAGGKRILLKGLKSKSKDSTYDAYFTPETIEDYNYTDKDNIEHYGKQFRFKMEFPQKKKK